MVESRQVRVCHNGDLYALETNRDITERKAHEEYIHLLTHEVNHRAKNMLSLVDAIARQTAAKNLEDFVERFSERIRALSANQDLLVRNEWKGVDADDLIRGQLAPFADLIGSRIAVHVAMGERSIDRQRELVASMERNGHDSQEAKRLLAIFGELHKLYIAGCDRLKEKLAEIAK